MHGNLLMLWNDTWRQHKTPFRCIKHLRQHKTRFMQPWNLIWVPGNIKRPLPGTTVYVFKAINIKKKKLLGQYWADHAVSFLMLGHDYEPVAECVLFFDVVASLVSTQSLTHSLTFSLKPLSKVFTI